MDIGEIKKRLQEHFTDGLVAIVGSGLSMASGLPGMEELAKHLIEMMEKITQKEVQKAWAPIGSKLAKGVTLEEALKDIEIDNPVLEHIVCISGRLLESRERDVVNKVYSGELSLPFTKLLPYLSLNSVRTYVITTNYDRLIEIAAEMGGFGIDTLFPGQYYGELNPDLSKESLWTGKLAQKGKSIKRVFRKHLVVLKPHGSLDWFLHNGRPIRCTISIDAPRLMITPGQIKYRMGYEQPFDRHRDIANRAIDSAARFLIIGYGFNDDQLQTHLTPEINKGKPCVILTKELSNSTRKFIQGHTSIIAICRAEDEEKGTKVIYEGKEINFPGSRIWDLGDFIKEVLQ